VKEITFKAPPTPCEYLPAEQSQLRYELIPNLHIATYMRRLKEGSRRFGAVVFRPDCPECQKCQSLRVPVETFRPNQAQRRAWNRNVGEVTVKIDAPSVTPAKLQLFAAFHAYGHQTKGWQRQTGPNLDLFVVNPFPTEEWGYYLGDRLIGVGYVDALPEGLSAIYFYWDPADEKRSLGTFNILTMIEAARQRGLPHVYLGYYVEGCRSLEYKARFRPNEILIDGRWTPFSK
jgi:arginine-tRNA-protein transferase